MTHGIRMERLAVAAHIVAMVFGVAGLVLVLPHPAWVLALPAVGQRLFAWSMAGGGIVYILLGALAVILYGVRVLGARLLWGFFVPAVGLSLASELLGTSTGFPFGHYGYLDGSRWGNGAWSPRKKNQPMMPRLHFVNQSAPGQFVW